MKRLEGTDRTWEADKTLGENFKNYLELNSKLDTRRQLRVNIL